eukprot:g315.t1
MISETPPARAFYDRDLSATKALPVPGEQLLLWRQVPGVCRADPFHRGPTAHRLAPCVREKRPPGFRRM